VLLINIFRYEVRKIEDKSGNKMPILKCNLFHGSDFDTKGTKIVNSLFLSA